MMSDPDALNANMMIPAALAAIPGLEVELGLNVLSGDMTAYKRLLRLYAADHANDIGLLRERMSQGDRDEARRLAHTLKGGSGNLGAPGVQRLAAELEMAIRDGRDTATIEQMASAAETGLQQLIAGIRTALPEEVSAPYSGELDWEAVRQILAELESMLAASSIQAYQFIGGHAPQLKAVLGPLGAKLEQQIELFLYPDAMESIRLAREQHPELAMQAHTAPHAEDMT